MDGGGSWIRTNVGVSQRVYNPSPLAARASLPIHTKKHMGAHTKKRVGRGQYEHLPRHVNTVMPLNVNSLLHPAHQVLKPRMAKRKKYTHGRAKAVVQGQAPDQTRPLEKVGKTGKNWIYGRHACLAAIANPVRHIRRIVLSTQGAEEIEAEVCDAGNRILENYPDAIRPSVEYRDRRELSALLPRDAVHQGICIDASPLPHPVIEDLIEEATGLNHACLLVLDQATDPRNIGAVMRTAAAMGALGIVVQDKHAPEITGTMMKAASGAVERLPLVRVTNLARTLDLLKQAEFWCVGFDGHATEHLSAKTLQGRNVVVLGAEGAGLRRLTRETCDLLVKIPILDTVESLNLSNAAAIALYQYVQSNT